MWASVPWRRERGGRANLGTEAPSHQPFPPQPSSLTSGWDLQSCGGWGFSLSLTDWETGLQGRTCSPDPKSAPGCGTSMGTKLPCPLSLPVTPLYPFKGGLSRNKHLQYFLDGPMGENEPPSNYASWQACPEWRRGGG